MKKLLRGEIWTGKRCIDGYMKELLREMLEYREAGRKGSQYDVWYSGRFFDTWAGPELLSGLNCAYGAYNRASLEAALAKTMELFSAAAQETGRLYGFLYPAGAEAYAFAAGGKADAQLVWTYMENKTIVIIFYIRSVFLCQLLICR